MHERTPDTGLDSFVIILADELPGAWTSQYHPDLEGDNNRAGLTAPVWDLDEVADAIARHTVDVCAVLTRDDGTRLFVADPLGHDVGHGYLIAAMAPQNMPAEAFRGVREPDGITVPADPFRAAEDVAHNLLPRYDKALAQVHSNASRLAPPQSQQSSRVVMAWSGDDLVVAKPDRADVGWALTDHGFVFDPNEDVFVLSGDDSRRQSASVLATSKHLSELGIGVVIPTRQARPALDTSAVLPPSVPVAVPHRIR